MADTAEAVPAETVFTPTENPAAPNAGFSRFSNNDELDAGPPSLSSFMPATQKQFDTARSNAQSLQELKLDADAQAQAVSTKRLEEDRRLQRRYLDAEAFSADNIPKPWNADEEQAKRIRGPFERFGDVATVFAMIASGFSRQPAIAALNAGAAAMTAIHNSDEAGYEKAYTAWKDNTNLAIKRFDMQHTLFADSQHLFATDMENWRAQNLANAARFKDMQALNLLQNGQYPEFFEAEEKRAKAVDGMRAALNHGQFWDTQQKAWQAGVKDIDAALPPKDPATGNLNAQARFILQEMMKAPFGSVEYIVGQKAIDYIKENKKYVSAEDLARIRQEASARLYSGSKVGTGGYAGQVQKLAQTLMLPKEEGGEGLSEDKAILEARRRMAQAAATARIDQALVNELEHYPGMDRNELGYIPPPAQTRLRTAFESSRNLEAIAQYVKEHPRSIGLVADASRRMNLDAYQGMWGKSKEGVKEHSDAERDKAIDKIVKEQKLDTTQAAEAKVLGKMLTTQAFSDAAAAGSRGATIYLDKAFKEIYQQASSPQAFFSILEKRYDEANRVAEEYHMGFDRRDDLDHLPFWVNKAAAYAPGKKKPAKEDSSGWKVTR